VAGRRGRRPGERGRCSICRGYGHTRRTCPNRLEQPTGEPVDEGAAARVFCPKCGTPRVAAPKELMVVLLTTTPDNPIDGLGTLNSCNGIRVYEADTPDPRSMLGRGELPPIFDAMYDAVEWLSGQAPREWCRLRFDEALRTLGPQEWAFYLPGHLTAPAITYGRAKVRVNGRGL